MPLHPQCGFTYNGQSKVVACLVARRHIVDAPPPPPPNAPPKEMSQMMVIKNASYRGEILATSTARLFRHVFDYPHIRFWHFAHNTCLRRGPVKYGENSQIMRRNPTECMCVSARFNLTTPAGALLVDAYHFHQNWFCRQLDTEVCLETDISHQNLLHRDNNRKTVVRFKTHDA